MDHKSVEIQKELFAAKKSKIAKYQDLIVGEKGIFKLLKYELIITITSWVPGALGLLLRSKFYPMLFKKTGANVNFGMNVVIRHPGKISIGNNVVIDDNVVLDAKGTDNKGIVIGNGVFIGRNTILSCKNGDIELEDNVNLGFNCEIFSGSSVKLSKSVLVAAYSYFIGGGHEFDRADVAVIEQSRNSKGITIGEGVWVGAGVKVLDGTSVGQHSILGAGAVVSKSVPDYSVAVGIPAKVIKTRTPKNTQA
jgi:acetyltransferase-like isoleucine patch superfamily enzyme